MPNREDPHKKFKRMGISTASPGFYTHPAFATALKDDRYILESYADLVHQASSVPGYLDTVRTTIVQIAEYVQQQATQHNYLGSGLELCMLISRLLEKERIWSYIIKGALTVNFHNSTSLSRFHSCPFQRLHTRPQLIRAWVCAPPFKIVDITELPVFRSDIQVITAERPAPSEVTLDDLAEPAFQHEFEKQTRRDLTLAELRRMKPRLFMCMSRYGVWQLELPPATLRYVSCSIALPDNPFETIRTPELGGRSVTDLYKGFIAFKKTQQY